MRLAIISDTHMPKGGRRLPARCVGELRSSDAILHGGDFVELSVLRELESLGPPVHAVRGNVDRGKLRGLLPETATVQAEGVSIGMVHDAGPAQGRLARLRRRFPGAHAVVFGHSHLPLHQADDSGFTIFNPGSPTERRRASQLTMGVATVAGGRVFFELVAV